MSTIRTIPSQEEIYRVLTEARRLRADCLTTGVLRVGKAIAGFLGAIGAVFAEARRQQALYEELSRKTDFELRDIGLNRSDIPAVVAGLMTRKTGRKTLPVEAVAEVGSAPAAPPASPSLSDHPIAA